MTYPTEKQMAEEKAIADKGYRKSEMQSSIEDRERAKHYPSPIPHTCDICGKNRGPSFNHVKCSKIRQKRGW